MAHSEAFNQLANGSIIAANNTLYFGVLGPWWVLIFFVLVLFGIQWTTKESGATAIFGIMGSAFLIKYCPQGMDIMFQGCLYLIIVLCLGMLLYKVFGK